jgi:hypothetical protein
MAPCRDYPNEAAQNKWRIIGFRRPAANEETPSRLFGGRYFEFQTRRSGRDDRTRGGREGSGMLQDADSKIYAIVRGEPIRPWFASHCLSPSSNSSNATSFYWLVVCLKSEDAALLNLNQ